MIPNIKVLTSPIEEVEIPSRTYKILLENDRISGYIDGLDAIIQAIYLILNTERYRHVIYSWDYGVELLELYGKPMPYVMSEAERRIKEALMQDDRIVDVTNFNFEPNGKRLHVTFDVITDYGTVQVDKDIFSHSNDPEVVGTLVRLYNDGTMTFNVPAFVSDNILLTNDLPTLDKNGVLTYGKEVR
jgi:hypothetical protein